MQSQRRATARLLLKSRSAARKCFTNTSPNCTSSRIRSTVRSGATARSSSSKSSASRLASGLARRMLPNYSIFGALLWKEGPFLRSTNPPLTFCKQPFTPGDPANERSDGQRTPALPASCVAQGQAAKRRSVAVRRDRSRLLVCPRPARLAACRATQTDRGLKIYQPASTTTRPSAVPNRLAASPC